MNVIAWMWFNPAKTIALDMSNILIIITLTYIMSLKIDVVLILPKTYAV